MQGGVKVYRGGAAAARHYVEADRSRADDYYLAEGTGLAERFTASPGRGVAALGSLDGDAYETWVAGCDPVTGAPRGRLRTDENAVRFVEVVVNGPKSWSLAAALHPEVAQAYDAAMDRAATQVIGWLAEHATTRVGPRGRQVQVPVERLEAVTVRHFTSRAGDPHRHLHLQVNARVFAACGWRGLHTVGVRDSLAALNGIGHAAMMTDPQFRAALAAHGFTLDPGSGEVVELAPYAGRFSERAAQIARNIDRFEAQWRRANPDQEPGPVVRRSWDRRAWKDARPDKVIPSDGATLVAHWVEQLHDLGYRDPIPQPGPPGPPGLPGLLGAVRVGALDRDEAVATVLTRLGARRSAWNAADVRGEVERWLAATSLVTDAPVRTEVAEDLTARVVGSCCRLLDRPEVPEHVRSLTSAHVLEVEADLVARLAGRAGAALPQPMNRTWPSIDALDEAQRDAVAVLAGDAQLVVVEGAAGAGKTTTLAATQEVLATQGRRMLVLTPTRKAAQVAAGEVGHATSVSWLVHRHGFRWDDDGNWTRLATAPDPVSTGGDEARLGPGDLVLVDEAGMLDQDTTDALLTVADEMGARIALVGDRHQLPAVGRGGVLDLAARWVTPQAHVDLEQVHRFADPEYAAISLALRTGNDTYPAPHPVRGEPFGGAPSSAAGEASDQPQVGEPVVREVFAALVARGQIRVHPSQAERIDALAQAAAAAVLDGRTTDSGDGGTLVVADTREEVAALNGAIRDRLLAAGHLDDTQTLVTAAGVRMGVGDRVVTRLNDADLGVTNRATWTVATVGHDGSLTLRGRRPTDLHTVPAAYAREHVELAYATTIYGAQGETTRVAHLLLGEHTTAASAYVALTRGRLDNVAHLVAEDLQEAHQQWREVVGRDRADLGPTVAAHRAAEEMERYGVQIPQRPPNELLAEVVGEIRGELWESWSHQADLSERHDRLLAQRDALRQVVAVHDRYAPDQDRLRAAEDTATQAWRHTKETVDALEQALITDHRTLEGRFWQAWHTDLREARAAAHTAGEGSGLFRQHRHRVREADEDLAGFATTWAPIIPDLPADPATLAAELTRGGSWLNTDRLSDAITTHVTAQVAAAHSDADTIRDQHRAARDQLARVRQARGRLDAAYYDEVEPFRYTVPLTRPREDLARVEQSLPALEHARATTTARVTRLEHDLTRLAVPIGAPGTAGGGVVDSERRAWQADRTQQQEAAHHEADLQRQRQHEKRRVEPTPPPRLAPDRGYGLGR